MNRWTVLLLTILAAFAALLLAGSLIPFSYLEPRVDALTADGDARRFTPESHRRMVAAARLAAAALGVAAAGLWAARRRFSRRLRELAIDARESALELAGGLRAAGRGEDPVHRVALAAICGVGIAWRILFLDTPMRGDEAYTYLAYVAQPLAVGMSYYSSPNNHLLHTALAHLSCGLFGNAPWAIRLPALAAGAAAIPAAYLAIRLHYGKQAALLGAAAVATSPVLIEFSTNARGYSLVVLAFLLLVALAAALADRPRPGLWAWFSLIAAAGIYAVPTMLYAFALVCAWLLLQSRNQPALRPGLAAAVLGAALLAAAAYAPALIVSGFDALLGHPAIASLPWSDFASAWPPRALALWNDWTRGLPGAVIALLVAGGSAALLLHRRLARRAPHPLAALALGVAPLILWQRVDPFSRVWLFLLPLSFGLAFAGLLGVAERLARPPSPRLAAAAALALSLAASSGLARPEAFELSDETGLVIDAGALAEYLGPRLRDGDQVVTTRFLGPPINYAFRRRSLSLDYLMAEPSTARRVWLVTSSGDAYEEALRRIDRVELPIGLFGVPTLAERFPRYHGAELYLLERYAPRRAAPPGRRFGLPGLPRFVLTAPVAYDSGDQSMRSRKR